MILQSGTHRCELKNGVVSPYIVLKRHVRFHLQCHSLEAKPVSFSPLQLLKEEILTPALCTIHFGLPVCPIRVSYIHPVETGVKNLPFQRSTEQTPGARKEPS